MRIIAGEFRSRVLKAPPGLQTRPTPDRLREALFSILQPQLEGIVFVDAYAGSGAVGLEALSRGARRVVFLEKDRAALAVLKQNAAALGVAGRVEIVPGPVLKALSRVSADTVFLDPPYEINKEYEACLGELGLRPPGLVLVQHAVQRKLAAAYGSLTQRRILRQGDNVITFFDSSR